MDLAKAWAVDMAKAWAMAVGVAKAGSLDFQPECRTVMVTWTVCNKTMNSLWFRVGKVFIISNLLLNKVYNIALIHKYTMLY